MRMYTGDDGGCYRTRILHWASTWWPTLHCESVIIYRVKFVVCLYTSIIHDYASMQVGGFRLPFLSVGGVLFLIIPFTILLVPTTSMKNG